MYLARVVAIVTPEERSHVIGREDRGIEIIIVCIYESSVFMGE